MAVDIEAIAVRWSEITDQSIGEAQETIEALLTVIDDLLERWRKALAETDALKRQIATLRQAPGATWWERNRELWPDREPK